jgi:hypothetical protein
MAYISRFTFEDEVSKDLTQQIDAQTFENVRSTLREWLAHRPSSADPLYLVLGNGTLTAGELASEIDEGTEIGISYVEIFIAGALRSKSLDLKGSVQALLGNM